MMAVAVQAYHDGDGTGAGAGIHAASVAFTATDGGGAYNLQLVNWGNGSGVPTSGKDLVIVGIDSNGLLHIRIFGANGNLITDTDEAELPQTPTELALIATLKDELPSLLAPNYVLTAGDKAQVLAEATLIAGQASSQITSIATAVSLAAALSGEVSVAVSLGLSLATNEIDNDVDAYIANASHGVTTTSGGISLTAIESATITSVTAAASLAAAGSLGAGVAISGAGAEATNTILGTDNAYVSASNLTSAAGVGLDALDTSQISAQVIAASVSLGIGLGGGGVGASIGISVAQLHRQLRGYVVHGLRLSGQCQRADAQPR